MKTSRNSSFNHWSDLEPYYAIAPSTWYFQYTSKWTPCLNTPDPKISDRAKSLGLLLKTGEEGFVKCLVGSPGHTMLQRWHIGAASKSRWCFWGAGQTKAAGAGNSWAQWMWIDQQVPEVKNKWMYIVSIIFYIYQAKLVRYLQLDWTKMFYGHQWLSMPIFILCWFI